MSSATQPTRDPVRSMAGLGLAILAALGLVANFNGWAFFSQPTRKPIPRVAEPELPPAQSTPMPESLESATSFENSAPAPVVDKQPTSLAALQAFCGVWKVDREASQSVAPLLKALGRSSAEIFMAERLSLTHVLTLEDGGIKCSVESPIGHNTDHLVPNDQVVQRETKRQERLETRTRWGDTDRELVTDITLHQPPGKTHIHMLRRLIDNGQTQTIDSTYRLPNGITVSFQRVLRRSEP